MLAKLLAALILLLVDCYGKRSLAQEDDWLLFAKSGQPVPAAFAGDGNLLSRMLLNRDTAVKDLRDYLVEQTKEAYQIASQFLSARASVVGYSARSKELLVRYDSAAGDTRALSELEAFQREWREASRKEAELRKEAEKRCEGIRSFLTTDSNGSGKRLDEDGLKRFVKEEGDISATGLRELHTYLSGCWT